MPSELALQCFLIHDPARDTAQGGWQRGNETKRNIEAEGFEA